jgi:hypothetical protein
VDRLHTTMLKAIGPDGEHLDMTHWHHPCGTSHCRAGHTVILAGAAGKDLERLVGTGEAARLIAIKSCPWLADEGRIDFHCSDDQALADIRACAEREQAER